MTANFRYLRCDWKNAPDGEPLEIYYECSPDGDVYKIAEYFEDDVKHWDDLSVYEENGLQSFGVNSLVEGDFRANVALQFAAQKETSALGKESDLYLQEISKEQFCQAFALAKKNGEWCQCQHVVNRRSPTAT